MINEIFFYLIGFIFPANNSVSCLLNIVYDLIRCDSVQ